VVSHHETFCQAVFPSPRLNYSLFILSAVRFNLIISNIFGFRVIRFLPKCIKEPMNCLQILLK